MISAPDNLSHILNRILLASICLCLCLKGNASLASEPEIFYSSLSNHSSSKGTIIAGRNSTQLFSDINNDGAWDTWEIRTKTSTIQFDVNVGGVFRRLKIQKRRKNDVHVARFVLDQHKRVYRLVSVFKRPYQIHYLDEDQFIQDKAVCGNEPTSNLDDLIKVSCESEKSELANELKNNSVFDPSCKTDEAKTIYNQAVKHLAKKLSISDSATQAFHTCLDTIGAQMDSLRIRANNMRMRQRHDSLPVVRCEAANTNTAPKPRYEEITDSIVLPVKSDSADRDVGAELDHELLHQIGIQSDQEIKSLQTCCPEGAKIPLESCSDKMNTYQNEIRFLETVNPVDGLFEFFTEFEPLSSGKGAELVADFTARRKAILSKMYEMSGFEQCKGPLIPKNPSCASKALELLRNESDKFISENCDAYFQAARCSQLRDKTSLSFSQHISQCAALDSGQKCATSVSGLLLEYDTQLQVILPNQSTLNATGIAEVRANRQSGLVPDIPNAQQPVLGPTVNFNDTRPARAAVREQENQGSDIVRTAEKATEWVAIAFPGGGVLKKGSQTKRRNDTAMKKIDVPNINTGSLTKSAASVQGRPSSFNNSSDSGKDQRTAKNPWDDDGDISAVPSADPGVTPIASNASMLGIPLVMDNAVQGFQSAAASLGSPFSPSPSSGSSRGSRGRPARSVAGANSGATKAPALKIPEAELLPTMRKSFTDIREILEDEQQKKEFIKFLEAQGIRIFTPFGESFGAKRPKIRMIYKTVDSPPEEIKVGK